ncbi:hypothetical protein ACJMK2_037860 [Sinanodonta woodiana]|uniref:Transmembrane protein 87A n=1 Tax=Sinanodonta woodiana TaxID=1069815 RepID=A0ABD3WNX2_SINWO
MAEIPISVLFTIASISFSFAFPQQGIWHVQLGKDQIQDFPKTMYNGTKVRVDISCQPKGNRTKLHIRWVMRYSLCVNEYDSTESFPPVLVSYLDHPAVVPYQGMAYKNVEYIANGEEHKCDGTSFSLHGPLDAKPVIKEAIYPSKEDQNTTQVTKKEEAQDKQVRKNRDVSPSSNTTKLTSKSPVTVNSSTEKPSQIDPLNVVQTWKDGAYIFVLTIEAPDDFDVNVTVRMIGPYGYISAVEWPLLVFYGLMGLVYITFGLLWLILLACNWRDLLRVQFWIGGVIFLGMLEKAVFYAEYQSISFYGESVTKGALIVAEIISCLKRAIARMLVIIVSLGFGIVKPRLGPTLHKVLCIGFLYFVAGTVEGCMRSLNPKGAQDKNELLAAIFSSLVQTTRTLRLRRNIVKLSLYRHFTNTLIFAVIASVIFMIWSLVQIKFKDCVKDWQELWLDEAVWHLLFSIILIIIMILWRPTANNQRYAYSPLLDAADDEEVDETVMNDAFEGMKMRTKSQANGSPKQKDGRNSIEDDLKWVEENIPSSITDKALPSLLDSDEEIVTAKYEMSKMQ